MAVDARVRKAVPMLWSLEGRTVLPGLIDSHVHATGAAVYEFDHEIPALETIDDVVRYVQRRGPGMSKACVGLSGLEIFLNNSGGYATG